MKKQCHHGKVHMDSVEIGKSLPLPFCRSFSCCLDLGEMFMKRPSLHCFASWCAINRSTARLMIVLLPVKNATLPLQEA